MKALQWKEWRLSMSPVPLLFLLLSGLILIPNYPYYVTFFYNGLGLFMLMQSLRENRDTAYLMLLPVTKAEMVRARFRTVVQLELLQVLACIPFMALRASYGHLNNAVGIEANTAFLGLGLVQMGLFNLVFFPMHYKNAYDLGKPFVAASVVEFFYIVLAEVCDHVIPYMKTVCESYALRDQLRQWPVQIKLVSPAAPYFDRADLLIAADCTAYAYGNFHSEFMRGKVTLIGCPKLDAVQYAEKLTEIFARNDIRSVTLTRMEVPCCGGMEFAIRTALGQAGKEIPFRTVVLSIDGAILEER